MGVVDIFRRDRDERDVVDVRVGKRDDISVREVGRSARDCGRGRAAPALNKLDGEAIFLEDARDERLILAPIAAQDRYAKGGRLTPWTATRVPRPMVPLGTSRDPIVPIVGSGVAGPLDLLHLPRLWMEGLLRSVERLDPEFSGGQPLFDEILSETIELDRSSLHAFLAGPPYRTYIECEAWVGAHAGRLDVAAIAQSNNALRKASIGGMPIIALDDLKLWAAVHRRVVEHPPASLEAIVPAISTRTAGPSGIDHLPRLWLKGILIARGALPFGYRAASSRVVEKGVAFVPGGLDAATCERIALDMEASSAFIESELPDYPRYEAWVLANAQRLDARTIARHNAVRDDTRASKAEAEKVYAGWPQGSNWSYLIDDLIDWRLLFEIVSGAPLPPWTGPRS
jgi:hypothetical protein